MLVESLKEAFETWKTNIVDSVVFGIVLMVVGLVSLIPLAGAFLGAYIIPRVLRWYFEKLGLPEGDADFSTAFKAFLIPSLVMHLGLVFVVLKYGLDFFVNLAKGGVGPALASVVFGVMTFLLVVIIAIVLGIILVYTQYGSVLGIVREFKIDVYKSLKVFAIGFVASIVFGIIGTIIGYIPSIGGLLNTIYQIVFLIPYISLVYAFATKKA